MNNAFFDGWVMECLCMFTSEMMKRTAKECFCSVCDSTKPKVTLRATARWWYLSHTAVFFVEM